MATTLELNRPYCFPTGLGIVVGYLENETETAYSLRNARIAIPQLVQDPRTGKTGLSVSFIHTRMLAKESPEHVEIQKPHVIMEPYSMVPAIEAEYVKTTTGIQLAEANQLPR
jgi:hypothetical protein